MSGDRDQAVVASWQRNAQPWTTAVRAQQIASRRLVTDAAIVDAVLQRAPKTVLDAGCGEGWLARALAERDVRVLGTDVVAELVEQARALGGAEFRVASYDELAGVLAARFDVVVCNFALIGDAPVRALFAAMPSLLQPGGAFIVQTLHPLIAGGELPYVDGWRPGSWDGCVGAFRDPAPWYFRTLSGWQALFAEHGLALAALREPLHPATGKPASLIFIAEVAAPR
jgi:2-polyprenyl-3-methyl-5-hydroxy-6-metoxy-1,4-benzoquinol methylase